jgi:hypothetical protein
MFTIGEHFFFGESQLFVVGIERVVSNLLEDGF